MKQNKSLAALTSAVLLLSVFLSLFLGIRKDRRTGVADCTVLTGVRVLLPSGTEDTFYEYDKKGRQTRCLFLNDGNVLVAETTGYYENGLVRTHAVRGYPYDASISAHSYPWPIIYGQQTETETYAYTENGDISEYQSYSDGELKYSERTVYDGAGRTEFVERANGNNEIHDYSADGLPLKTEKIHAETQSVYEVTIYSYDTQNRLLSIEDDGERKHKISFRYDAETGGKTARIEETYDQDGRCSYSYCIFYDSAGNITESGEVVDGDFVPMYHYEYLYDAVGRILSQKRSYPGEDGAHGRTETDQYTYDDSTGNVLRHEKTIFQEGELWYQKSELYEYDASGKKLLREEYRYRDTEDVPFSLSEVITYTYDDRGEPLKRDEYDAEKQTHVITTWEYAGLQDVYRQKGWISENAKLVIRAQFGEWKTEIQTFWQKLLRTVKSWF